MRALLSNTKGSVMSIAIVVIVILSFSITTATSYSINVAQRTNTVVETRSDDLLGESLLRQAINEFRDFLNQVGPASFLEFDTTFADEDFRQYLIDTYFLYDVRVQEDNLADNARVYRFVYQRTDGTRIFRDLYVALGETDDPTESIDVDEAIDDTIESILNDPESVDYFLEDSGDLVSTIHPDDGGTLSNSAEMDGDIFVNDDADITFSAVTGEFKMNGNILYINGNLDLSNIDKLTGPGIIFVTGNVTINQRFGFEINDVLMLVKGYTYINFDHPQGHQRRLEGSNFAIVNYDTTNMVQSNVAIEGNTYYNQGPPVVPNFRYIGDKPFEEYGDLQSIFEQFQLDIGGSSAQFVFNEGPVREEDE